jgi:esterase/lipase superfamily enzyme
MKESRTLYYATNRAHEGADRWNPTGYGKKFSSDGEENLRFGKVRVKADLNSVNRYLNKATTGGKGDGVSLTSYFSEQLSGGSIKAYMENAGETEANTQYGSLGMFDDVRAIMKKANDVVIYIHGFNVSWDDAVGSALALQEMLNKSTNGIPKQDTVVVLFTWPSNGTAMPWVSYRSDRGDAVSSGKAIARGILKLANFLRDPDCNCNQGLHLLSHSMGNFVLQNALVRLREHTRNTRGALPRIFEHMFLCSPDVDDDILEPGGAMGDVHQLARCVTVYHTMGDLALHGSDYTKGNPDRLGSAGPARPQLVHNKVHSVDCSPIVSGFMEHSYYLGGRPNQDIRASIAGMDLNARIRGRRQARDVPNVWSFPKRRK